MSRRVETLAAAGKDWPEWTVVLTDEVKHAWTQHESGLPGFVEWTIHEVQATEDDGTILYSRVGASASGDYVADLAEAECEARGTVKWDGCADWSAVAVHFCSHDDTQSFAAALLRAYEMACEWMGTEAALP